jgi:hypothetical protein
LSLIETIRDKEVFATKPLATWPGERALLHVPARQQVPTTRGGQS